MTPTRSERGAVNIMFLVAALVIGIAGWVAWYLQYSDNDRFQKEKQVAVQESTDYEEKFFRARDAYNRLAREAGGTGIQTFEDIDISQSRDLWAKKIDEFVRPVQDEVAAARNLFAGDESQVVSLLDIATPAKKMIDDLKGEVAGLTTDRDSQRDQRVTAERANTDLISTHSDALRTKNGELNDTRDRLNAQLQTAENNHEKTSNQLRSKSTELEEATAKYREELEGLRDTTTQLDAAVAQFKAPEKIKRARQLPDGKVISVNPATGMAWIDIGSRKLLRRGTRFETFALRKGGRKVRTGFVEVHDIERDRARCKVEGGAVSGGDLIYNPFFDPAGPKVFYFLGTMTGSYDNQEAQAILKRNGAKVVSDLTLEVDFLVLGANPSPDAEVGPDADGNWFKETPQYNDALRWGIEMIRARDLSTYLQY